VSKEEKLVGKCHVCEINVYDRGELNRPFMYLGKQRQGYPRDVAMPCGLNYEGSTNKELTAIQKARCPFETEKEQNAIDDSKGVGIISGKNNWEGIT